MALFCNPLNKTFLPLHKKIRLLLNYFLGPVLFIGIGFSIYHQVIDQPQLTLHWQHIKKVFLENGRGYLPVILLFMLINWGLESKKWQMLTSHLQPISFGMAVKSVMAGVSFTMLTPNRMGEFLGRVLYLPDGSRIRAATLTMLSSISQLAVTLFAGTLGLLWLKKIAPQLTNESFGWTGLLVNVLLYGSSLCILLGLFIYFNIGWLSRQLEKFPPFSKYAYFMHPIGEIHYKELLKLLALSIIRYCVFMVQYGLVFRFLEIDISLNELISSTSVMFLILAMVPTIALAELGIRGKVSLFVFGLFSSNSLEILVATAVIWFINIIFPAVAGSFMLLGVKIFKKT